MDNYNKLDVAAKLFPAVSNKSNSSVFRVAVILKEKVDAMTLQLAVNLIYERYRLFFLRLRRGVFWNYFDENHLRFTVQEEDSTPCQTIISHENKGYIIKVLHYGNRISVEAYHAITDGSGVVEFLKSLVYYYLVIKYGDMDPEGKVLLFDQFDGENLEDSFNKNFSRSTKNRTVKKIKQKNSFRLSGKKFKKGGYSAISGIVSVSALKEVCKQHNCTITAFIISVMIMSIYEEKQKNSNSDKPIVIAVPVNLRTLFSSKTLKNFFGVINVGCKVAPSTTFSEVIEKVCKQLSLSADKEYLESLSRTNVSISNNIFTRHTPLLFKNLILPVGFTFTSENKKTMSISNIGKINFPTAVDKYIEHAEVFMYPTHKSPINCAICTVGDKMTVNFTKSIVDASVMRKFFTTLMAHMSDRVTVYSNCWGEDNE